MTSVDKFESYKSELTSILSQIQNLGMSLQDDHDFSDIGTLLITEAKNATAKAHDSLFTIALVGAFQSGKSTTCNIFSGGRELSPRGMGGGGVKVSSCLVKINYSDDPAEITHIAWHSKEEIENKIYHFIGNMFTSGDALESNEVMHPDMDDPAYKKFVLQRLQEEVSIYQKLAKDYSDDHLDDLKTTALLYTFYDDPTLKKLRSKSTYNVAEIQKYIRFPDRPSEKWIHFKSKGLSILDDFIPSEVAYLFIKGVTIPTQSQFLKRTGCAVVDAPGLMANYYDSQLAIQAMNNADAIFYLLSDLKDLTKEDQITLQRLQQSGIGQKVFFGINYHRDPRSLMTSNILSEIHSKLHFLEYDQPHQKDFLYFNAAFALKAMQGRLLLDNAMDVHTQRVIVADAEAFGFVGKDQHVVENAWRFTCSELMRQLRTEGFRTVETDPLDETLIMRLEEAGCWEKTISQLYKFVFDNKASMILVDGVAEPTLKMLADLEARLTLIENAADKNIDMVTQQYDKAGKLLESFHAQANVVIDQHITTKWDAILSEDFFEKVLLPAGENAARASAEAIDYESTTILNNVNAVATSIGNIAKKASNFLFNTTFSASDSVIAVRAEKIIRENLDSEVCIFSTKWNAGLENSNAYAEIIQDVESVIAKLEKIWIKSGLDKNAILKHYKPLKEFPSGRFSVDTSTIKLSSESIGNLMQQNYVDDVLITLSTALATMGMVFGSSMLYLTILPVNFVIPFFAELVMLASALVVAIVQRIFADKKEQRIRTVRENLITTMQECLMKHKKEILISIVNAPENRSCSKSSGRIGLHFYRSYYLTLFKDLIQQQEADFETEKLNALAFLRTSIEEQVQLTLKATKLREEHISPLSQLLKTIICKIQTCWPKTGFEKS